MKLILATIHLEASTRAIPLAAACLKAEVSNHDVVLQNYTLEQNAEEICRRILEESPDAAGFPVYLWNRKLVLEVISILQHRVPDLPILAGGPEVTAAPEAFLQESGICAVMQGEGEVLINPVLDALSQGQSLPEINGLWTSAYSPVFPGYCSDINSLHSPILSGALDMSQNKGLLWELSRGCPFACDFCFESKGSGKVRTFSLERVRKELEMIRDFGIEQVFVLDPTFNVQKKRVLTILEWIRELTPHTYYYFEIRTEFLDEETAAAFASIPCTLQIGLQSSDPDVLQKINRKFDPEAFGEKVSFLGDGGVSFGLDLIYGLPGDSLEGFRRSLNYALNLEPNHLDLFPLAVLPGTALFDRLETLNLSSDHSDPYLVQETDLFSKKDLEKARNLSISCDTLYNQGRGISWFSRVCYDLELEPVDVVTFWSIYEVRGFVKKASDVPAFLKSLYKENGKSDLYPVIQDLLSYLDLLEELEQMVIPDPEKNTNLTSESLLTLHATVRFQIFHTPPDLILEGFPGSSEELMREKGDYQVLLWRRDDSICMDILEKEELRILKKLQDNRIQSHEISTSLSTKEKQEFLKNGLLEGYVQSL